jgi:hypothetical protein
MARNTGTGTCVAVSTADPATHDAAGFAALTYTQVGELEALGEVTINHQPVNFTNLCNGRTSVAKGSEDPVTFDITCANDHTDAGQIILRTARASLTEVISVRITEPTGYVKYLAGYVMSSREAGGAGPNDIQMTVFTIGVVAPATGDTVVIVAP